MSAGLDPAEPGAERTGRPGVRLLTVIGVPIDSVGVDGGSESSDSEGRLSGTERAPRVLRALGLLSRLGPGAGDAGDLSVRIRGDSRDATTGVIAWPDVADMSDVVKRAVAEELAAGGTPVLIGGCCALEPAAVAGARSALGQVGVVHIDGHLDLYDGVTSATGEAADMPMAVILGQGPAAWVDRFAAALPGAEAAALGHRDPDEIADGFGSRAQDLGVMVIDADTLRQGPVLAARSVAERLPIPLWIHLDVDVLDREVFAATDYLMPGGLTLAELRLLLVELVDQVKVVGFSLACYNPDKDPDLSAGRALVSLLAECLPLMDRGATGQGGT